MSSQDHGWQICHLVLRDRVVIAGKGKGKPDRQGVTLGDFREHGGSLDQTEVSKLSLHSRQGCCPLNKIPGTHIVGLGTFL